jgi:hypothetical protein
MFLKFIILFVMVLTMTLSISYKVTTLVKYLKGENEKPSSYYVSLAVLLVMVISISLYFTLY